MRKLLTLLLLSISITTFAQDNEKAKIHAVITSFFDGLSELNESKITLHTTTDFMLLEDGAVWNNDSLVKAIRPMRGRDFKRINKFDFFATDIKDDVAWVSYHNTANISVENFKGKVEWLESAILVKQNNVWLIKQMHSTRKK